MGQKLRILLTAYLNVYLNSLHYASLSTSDKSLMADILLGLQKATHFEHWTKLYSLLLAQADRLSTLTNTRLSDHLFAMANYLGKSLAHDHPEEALLFRRLLQEYNRRLNEIMAEVSANPSINREQLTSSFRKILLELAFFQQTNVLQDPSALKLINLSSRSIARPQEIENKGIHLNTKMPLLLQPNFWQIQYVHSDFHQVTRNLSYAEFEHSAMVYAICPTVQFSSPSSISPAGATLGFIIESYVGAKEELSAERLAKLSHRNPIPIQIPRLFKDLYAAIPLEIDEMIAARTPRHDSQSSSSFEENTNERSSNSSSFSRTPTPPLLAPPPAFLSENPGATASPKNGMEEPEEEKPALETPALTSPITSQPLVQAPLQGPSIHAKSNASEEANHPPLLAPTPIPATSLRADKHILFQTSTEPSKVKTQTTKPTQNNNAATTNDVPWVSRRTGRGRGK